MSKYCVVHNAQLNLSSPESSQVYPTDRSGTKRGPWGRNNNLAPIPILGLGAPAGHREENRRRKQKPSDRSHLPTRKASGELLAGTQRKTKGMTRSGAPETSPEATPGTAEISNRLPPRRPPVLSDSRRSPPEKHTAEGRDTKGRRNGTEIDSTAKTRPKDYGLKGVHLPESKGWIRASGSVRTHTIPEFSNQGGVFALGKKDFLHRSAIEIQPRFAIFSFQAHESPEWLTPQGPCSTLETQAS